MKVKRICKIGILSAFLALCAWITVPGPVPFTLQTFAVFLAIMLLGGKDGFFAIAVYVVLGIAGLPVFSGFRSGIGVLLGATGGYIVGFLITPFIMLPFENRGRAVRIISSAAALVTCYIFGTLWYAFVYMSGGKEFDFISVLLACVAPFIIPDIIKITLSFVVSERIRDKI